MQNAKKVQFIICVTDQREVAECKFYMSKLQIPEGIEIELTEVVDAESMTAGYNAAMQSSDAKYRIYLHQDTFVVYPRMLYDLISVFENNTEIGMLGVVGAREIPKDRIPHKAWDLGRVDTNVKPLELNYQKERPEKGYWPAEAVDGLLIATQKDVRWRDDLFHKFDFYDISQAVEMWRNGYMTVVPYQDKKAFECREIYQFSTEQEEVLEAFQQEVLRLIDEDGIQAVEGLLEQYHELLGSKAKLIQLENICYIRKIEKSAGCKIGELYGENLSAEELFSMFREDKFCIKRIEYGYSEDAMYLLERYRNGRISKEAVFGLAVCYVKNRDVVIKEFERMEEF